MAVKTLKERLTFNSATIGQLTTLQAEYTSLKSANTDKSQLSTDVTDELEALKALWPFANQAAFEAAIDASKATVAGIISTGIHVVDEFKAAILADITDPYTCVYCAGKYKVKASQDAQFADGDTSTEVACPLCLSEGTTSGQFELSYPSNIIPDVNAV